MLRLVLSTCCWYLVIIMMMVKAYQHHTNIPFVFRTISNNKLVPSRMFTIPVLQNEKSIDNENHEYVPVVHHRLEKKPFRRKRQQPFTATNSVDHNKLQWLQQATEQLLQLYTSSTNTTSTTTTTTILPDGKWHEAMSLYNAWIQFQKVPGSNTPYYMESILNILIMVHLHKTHNNNTISNGNIPIITIDLYNKLIDAWACMALFHNNNISNINNPMIAAQRVHEILLTLQDNYEKSIYTNIQSSYYQQNTAKNTTNASCTLVILPIQPNTESFHIALHVLCKIQGVFVARRLLAYMEHLYRHDKNKYAQPTKSQYIQILDAYAKLDNSNTAYQSSTLSEAFLRHLQYTHQYYHDDDDTTNNTPLQLPDTLCYNIVMKAYSRQQQQKPRRGREIAEHADRLLEEMKHSESIHCRPDIVTYGSVISAWAASGMKVHAINRVEKLIREIEESDYLETNTVVLNALMSAWVKAKNPGAVGRTEEILRQMEQSTNALPDLVSYNTYLHALSYHSSTKRPDLSLRAEALLRRMDDEYKNGVLPFGPNTFSYNLVIEAIARGPQDKNTVTRAANLLRRMIHSDHLSPDTFSFNQVLTLLSKSSKTPSHVEELFRHMDNAYKAGIYAFAKPDIYSFHALMMAYSYIPGRDSAMNVERLLNEMKHRALNGEIHLKPNRLCYNTLIDCWAKSGEGTYGARKAEAILHEMQDKFFAGDFDVSPNIMTFNAVLNAWARSGTRCCGYKAEKYLNQMWKLYNAGNVQVKPNDFSYNTVINAISKSKHKEKGQKALRVLRRMDKSYLAGNKDARPNEITYTAVINSCAFPSTRDSRTRRKALDTAMFTLKELQGSRYGKPNQVTYGTFIRACSNLLHDDYELRSVMIKKAFEQCCKDGQVGQMVLNYIPKDLYGELFDGYSAERKKLSLDDLPFEWKRNVDEKIQWGPKRNSNSINIAQRRQ